MLIFSVGVLMTSMNIFILRECFVCVPGDISFRNEGGETNR